MQIENGLTVIEGIPRKEGLESFQIGPEFLLLIGKEGFKVGRGFTVFKQSFEVRQQVPQLRGGGEDFGRGGCRFGNLEMQLQLDLVGSGVCFQMQSALLGRRSFQGGFQCDSIEEACGIVNLLGKQWWRGGVLRMFR